jgi:ABC-type transport system substrate-binding protein
VIAPLVASIVLAGCPKESPKARGLVLGTIEEPDTLDPAFTEIAGAQEIVRLLFRDLCDFDPDWSIRPALAARRPEITTSTAGEMRLHWRLLPDLAWSDGAPLTAADVVFGHAIASDPKLDVTALRSPPELLRVVEVSPLEFIALWKTPFANADAPRTHAILPKHAYPDPKRAPAPFRGLGRTPVSNGPYRMKTWTPGQHLILEPNPYWAGAKPSLPSITFRFFKSEDAFEAELRTGGIDALGEASGLSIERADGLGDRLKNTHEVTYSDSGLALHLVVRLDHPVLGDVRARRAISNAIDRAAMAKVVYGGHASPAYGLYPPRHLAHAGAAASTSTTPSWRAPNDLALEIQFASGSQASERAATFVQAAIEKLGPRVTLTALPLRVLFQKMKDKTGAPLAIIAWRTGPDFDGASLLHSNARLNYSGLADTAIDRLLDRAKHEPDPETWSRTLREVDARFRALLPSIPLLFRQAVSVHPKGLEGWSPTGTTTPVTWNAERWHWVSPEAHGAADR